MAGGERKRMGVLGRKTVTKIAALAALFVKGSAASYQTRYEVPLGEQENYTVLVEDLGEYEVCEGDCLWSISENLLGNGGDYMQLVKQNADVIQNPDLIYPGMRLRIKRNVYVK